MGAIHHVCRLAIAAAVVLAAANRLVADEVVRKHQAGNWTAFIDRKDVGPPGVVRGGCDSGCSGRARTTRNRS